MLNQSGRKMICKCCQRKARKLKNGYCPVCYRQLIAHRKPKQSHKKIKRKCLKCGEWFWSEGNWNRLCDRCNEENRRILFQQFNLVE